MIGSVGLLSQAVRRRAKPRPARAIPRRASADGSGTDDRGLHLKKIVHRDDVYRAAVVRTQRRVTGRDPHASNALAGIERHPEERETSIGDRAGWHRRAVQEIVICVEVGNRRGIRQTTSVKTTPKPPTVAGTTPSLPGRKNRPSVTLLPTGTNRRSGLKVLKIVTYVGLARSNAKPSGVACEDPSPAWRKSAARVQEHVERRDRGVVALLPPPVPVDFAATDRERSRRIAVVGVTQGGPKEFDRGLDRGCSVSPPTENVTGPATAARLENEKATKLRTSLMACDIGLPFRRLEVSTRRHQPCHCEKV